MRPYEICFGTRGDSASRPYNCVMATSRFRTIEISDARFERDHLRCVTVKSPSLRARADVTLFVPPQIENLRDVPIVILLHGVYGSHWAWALKGGAHRTALRMIEAGEIAPLVLAMPSDGLWGDGGGYVPHTQRNFETWIVEHVPALVNEVVPQTRWGEPMAGPSLCIAGLSMGGFGALRLGAKYAHKFRAISAHSSLTHFDQLKNFVEEELIQYGVHDEDTDVFTTIMQHRAALPPLRFDCGHDDPLIKHNRVLHRQLLDAKIAHIYEEFTGGHEWAYWAAHLPDTLRFFSSVLRL